MLNKNINSRFEDWLLSPTETLDFEVKQWLDLADAEGRGAIAKALIALENHGGGFLLIGYKEENGRLVPDNVRPADVGSYNTDAINAILKKCAEPVFHAEVIFQKHPETGLEFPLIRVSGSSRVPVRSSSATAGKTLHQNIYYIRRPGPESDGPKSAAEWDQLMRRCMLAQREEIITVLRNFIPGGPVALSALSQSEHEILTAFNDSANARWRELNESLPPNHPARISRGHFYFSAKILGKSLGLPAKEVLAEIRAARKYTGWSTFVSLYDDATRPKFVDGVLQAWLANVPHPDVDHADFWRVDPKGNFFLLQGMAEDSPEILKGSASPGTVFDVTLPVWRLGEFLLRVNELGGVMFEEGFEVLVECEWTGLNGRALGVISSRRRVDGHYSSAQDNVRTSGQFSQAAIRDLLPEVVKALTAPLYEIFDFYQPADNFYAGELSEMKHGHF